MEADEQATWRLAAAHPVMRIMLDRWPRLGLPDAWLSGSLLAQGHWNAHFGLPPLHGIADVDIIYFDADDLSEEAEARALGRATVLFADLPVRLDVKNEARVHLWYPAKFGTVIPPYRSALHATHSFPTTASAVAIHDRALSAPFGLAGSSHPAMGGCGALHGYVTMTKRRCRGWWHLFA